MADLAILADMRVTTDYNVLNVCDVGLTIEMVDTEDGSLIWSSFVYSRWGKINGNPDRLFKRMVKECLKAFPKK